jgi:hypothetical protein
LTGGTGRAAETIKNERGSCTCRDCLKNFAQITPRGVKLVNASEETGNFRGAMPGHSVERYREKVTSTLAQKSYCIYPE